MPAAVCTLFEKQYHFGVASLANSLYKRGFRGAMYAGYKGDMPSWAGAAKTNNTLQWKGARTFTVAAGMEIHFLPIESNYNLCNYKPDFMLSLFNGIAKDVTGLAYFDPDIVVKCKWEFFEKWMGFGICMVHDVIYNDMPATHPTRMEWIQLIKESNRNITSAVSSYSNAGFCGVSKSNSEFLRVWSDFIKVAVAKYGFDVRKLRCFPIGHVFFTPDQDAFNIAAMCSGCPVSEVGPDGMDFMPGGWIMSHAVGSPKPWSKNYILSALKGRPVSKAETEYWKNVVFPIRLFSFTKALFKYRCSRIASFIGRFYQRY